MSQGFPRPHPWRSRRASLELLLALRFSATPGAAGETTLGGRTPCSAASLPVNGVWAIPSSSEPWRCPVWLHGPGRMLVMEIQPRELSWCPAPKPRALLASPARADPAAVTGQGKWDTAQRLLATGDPAHLQTPTALHSLGRMSHLWRRDSRTHLEPTCPTMQSSCLGQGTLADQGSVGSLTGQKWHQKGTNCPQSTLLEKAGKASPPSSSCTAPATPVHTGPGLRGLAPGAAGTPWGSPRPTSTHWPRCRQPAARPLQLQLPALGTSFQNTNSCL